VRFIDQRGLLQESEMYDGPDVGSITASNPTMRGDVMRGLLDLFRGDGSDPAGARRRAQAAAGLMDFVPIYGEAADLDAASDSFGRGQYAEGALNTTAAMAGLIPIVGDVAAKAIKEKAIPAVKKLQDQRTTNRAEMGVGRSKERVGTTGKYVGGPSQVTSPKALKKMRKEYIDSIVTGVEGADWYDDSSKWIQNVSGDLTTKGGVADTIAISSQGTGVDSNLGFAVKGINQRATGEPVKTGRFPGNQSPLIEQSLNNQSLPLGPKRQPFADNLTTEWNPERAVNGVHDIWQGRAFGYTHPNGKPWDAGFSPQQHAFMDNEMAVAVDFLNENKVGGRTDWSPKNAQAAAWTGIQIKSGVLDPADAAMHYGSFSPKYIANATSEQAPGANTGQLEGLLDLPYAERERFQNAAPWTNSSGQDQIYTSGGLLTEPSNPMVGAYTPTGGVLEINPGEVARPLVQSTDGVVNASGRAALDIGESSRAYIDTQNAGAWNKVIPDSQTSVGERTSLIIPMSTNPTPEQMSRASEIASNNGFFAVDTGDSINFINAQAKKGEVGFERTGASLGKELKGDLGVQLKAEFGTPGKRTKIDSGFITYEEAWQAGSGSGKATAQFLEKLGENEAFAGNIEDSLRAKAAANLKRDAQFSQEYALPVREDIQTARKIFSEQGRAGLVKALKRGAILPASVLAVMSPEFLEQNGNSQREI
jgi:hypothetical protein